jgi:hypothetical protein
MKNFETIIINRKVTVDFSHPKFVSAIFQAQSISFACQGNWKTEIVSIEREKYNLEQLIVKVESQFNILFY